MPPRKTIYLPRKDYELPDIDILTLIYDSPESWTQESTVLHAEAALPSNAVTKAQGRMYTKRLAWVFRHVFSIGTNGPGKDVVVCISSGQILLSNIFYGVIAAGGVFSAASSSFTAGELARQIKQGQSSCIVCSEDCRDVAMKAAEECGVPTSRVLVLESMGGKRALRDVEKKGRNWLDGGEEEWIRKRELLGWEKITDPKTLKDRVVCLLYSSGTTGVPKGESSQVSLEAASHADGNIQESISRTQISFPRA
jgi:acyl-coenzyme A synthetase/AMP-(fatty) acid ligase